MITIQTVGLLVLAGYFHITRDRIEVNYTNTVFAKLPGWLQNWFNPEISWVNKKSGVAIWQFIKSVILVDFTDFKHFLKFLEINTFILLIYTIYPYFGLNEWIAAYLIRGGGVYIGNLNFFGTIKQSILPTKKSINKRVILLVSLAFTVSYLVFIQLTHGQLTSISASAKFETFWFILFIWQLSLGMVLISYSWIIGIAGPLLAIITTFTGYHPEIADTIENTVHIVATNAAIILVLVDIVVNGLKIKKYREEAIFLVCLFLIVSGIMLIAKIPNWTYWIEVLCLGVVYLFYFIYKK